VAIGSTAKPSIRKARRLSHCGFSIAFDYPSPLIYWNQRLAGFCELIIGLQSVRGKILSPSELAVRGCMLLVRDGVSMGSVDFSVKVG